MLEAIPSAVELASCNAGCQSPPSKAREHIAVDSARHCSHQHSSTTSRSTDFHLNRVYRICHAEGPTHAVCGGEFFENDAEVSSRMGSLALLCRKNRFWPTFELGRPPLCLSLTTKDSWLGSVFLLHHSPNPANSSPSRNRADTHVSKLCIASAFEPICFSPEHAT